jgi:hypothetical protein
VGDPSASKSGNWAIQFTAPKTEAEAAAVARLNAKYAGALNGATIAVQKSQVYGDTPYAMRVAGLSKAEAEALCPRQGSRLLDSRKHRTRIAGRRAPVAGSSALVTSELSWETENLLRASDARVWLERSQ